MIETATAETMMSVLSSCRQWFFSAASMSRPLARASIKARSRIVTINWSRNPGDNSRKATSAIRNTTRPAMPQMRYSCVQNRWPYTAGMVMLPTIATIRLPSTGPLVQKPMAVARPTCGEKSRISAGVATRQMPSTTPTTKPSMVKTHLLVAAGRTNATKMPVKSNPKTTRFALPYLSVRPANSEPNAPIKLPNASVST